jgi:AAA+ superfamily predicted ATPase
VSEQQAPGFSPALEALARAGERAGLDVELVRAEGAALAATVAEPATGASRDWAAVMGSDVRGFFEAAVSARRFRTAPTPGLVTLVAAASPHSTDYAHALADVAASAVTLGTPSPRVADNAALAAAAQLAAAGVRPPDRLAGLLPPDDPPPGALPVPGRLSLPPADLPSLLTPGWNALAGLRPGLVGGREPGEGTGRVDDAHVPPQQVPAVADGADSTSAAVPEEPAKSLEELLAELDALIGLAEVKEEIHRQSQLLRVEKLRSEAGLRSPTITRHLVFLGNPGTGKTTVARLVAGIYRAIGLLSTGQLVEVDRSELVAGYLGQTATKTAEVAASAIGGVLFIDEAYSLAGDQYGEEAVDTLVKEMEDHRDDLVVVVAGYPAPMREFIESNPGLASRFRTVITFPDYTDDELVEIFIRLADDADYEIRQECRDRFREILATASRGEGFGNGRFARNVLEAAVGRHAWRLRDVESPTVQQLREMLPDDLSEVAVERAVQDGSSTPGDGPGGEDIMVDSIGKGALDTLPDGIPSLGSSVHGPDDVAERPEAAQ